MTSIKAYLYERAASPLLGSLVISWSVWNYKFLLLWVSGMTYSEKLRYINLLYSHDYHIYWQGMILPFITSMLYLFVFPYPAKFVYSFSLSRQEEMNKVKNEKQNNELLTVEQSRAIRQQLADVEKDADALIERKDRAIEVRDREIEELRKQLAEKDKQVEEPQSTIETVIQAQPPVQETSKSKTVSLEEVVKKFIDIGKVESPKTQDEYFAKILLSLYDSGGSKTVQSVTNLFDNKTKVRYYIDELKSKKYISQSGAATPRLSLNHHIKGYFVKNL